MEATRRAASLRTPARAWSRRESARRRESAPVVPCANRAAFVTRQFTGAALVPSSRFVSTVSMTVPSSTRCSGPAALIAGVWSGVRRCSAEGADAGKPLRLLRNLCGRVRGEAGGSGRGSDNRIGDFVYRRARGVCPCRRSRLRRAPTNVRPLVLRTPAQNDVAGKQALVFTPLSIGRDRILRRRRLRVVVRHRLDVRRRRGRLRISHRLRFEQPQSVLIVTNAVGARSLHGRRRRRWSRRWIRTSDDQHDRQHANGDARHHPGLHAAGQNASRNRTMVRDCRRSAGHVRCSRQEESRPYLTAPAARTRSAPCRAPDSPCRAPSARRTCLRAPGNSARPACRP